MGNNLNNIKMVALDLDGTLLNSNSEIPRRTAEIIQHLKKKYIFSVMTGRMYCASKPFVTSLGLDTYTGTYNGACIFDSQTDNCVYSCNMEPYDVDAVVRDCALRGIYFQIVGGDEFYFKDHCKYSEFYSNLCSKPGHAVGDIVNTASQYSVTKIIAMASEEDIPAEYGFFKEKYGERLQVVTSRPGFIEFTNKMVSKSTALEYIASHYGVGLNEVMAFGDQLNDISMIECAGVGVAMGNAHIELKKKADIVTLSNNEDGVAHILEKLL